MSSSPSAPDQNPKNSFWAFISYRHADNKISGRQWATWLHQMLETYEIPKDLVGTKNSRGEEIPERIFPVFRDEEELPVDADLATPIFRALDYSKRLIVICSPRAVESSYVAGEISYFKKIGKSDCILAAMIEGEPNTSIDKAKCSLGFSPEEECFPKPLQYEVDSSGNLTSQRTEPIAANFRITDEMTGKTEQGWTSPVAYRTHLKEQKISGRELSSRVENYTKQIELMKLKIIAGVLGVSLGELTKRDEAYQLEKARHKAKVLRRWLIAVIILTVFAIAGGIMAVIKQIEAEKQRDETTRAHLRLVVDTASQHLERNNVRMGQAMILEVLAHPQSHPKFNYDKMSVFQEAQALDSQIIGMIGHEGSINHAEFSPDNKYAVTSSSDNTVRIWDASIGSHQLTLKGHKDTVLSASYSPDGKHIASASADKTARIWDSSNGDSLKILHGHEGRVSTAVYSPDGKWIVTGSDDKTLRIWNAHTFALLKTLNGHEGGITSVVFSPDGHYVASSSTDKTSRIWKTTNWKIYRILSAHSEVVYSADFSPDGKHIATVSQDKTTRIWDLESGTSTSFDGHLGSIYSVNYSPDGKFLVTASQDQTIRIWDVKTKSIYKVLSGHLMGVSNAVYSKDGTRILSSSRDSTARIWSARPLRQIAVLSEHSDIVTSTNYSPDGKRIISTSGDKTACIWKGSSQSLLGKLKGHNSLISSATYSSNGKYIITSSYDHTAIIWDAQTFNPLKTLKKHSDLVTAAAFSPDSKQIATASFDKTVIIWDQASGSPLMSLEGHENTVRSVEFSPEGDRLVTASDDNTARIWDAETGKVLSVFHGHEDTLRSASFSPDGKFIATSSNDKTARIWDVESGMQKLVLRGHHSVLRSANYSPDGKYIVTSSYDSTGRIWDSHTGELLAVLPAHGDGVRSARYSPNGKNIVTALLDKTAVLWDARIQSNIEDQRIWAMAAQFDPLSTNERSRNGLPSQTYSKILNKTIDPYALAKEGELFESKALLEESRKGKNMMLLSAFKSYAQAIHSSPSLTDNSIKNWRYRQATIARILRQEGMLRDIASIYKRYL